MRTIPALENSIDIAAPVAHVWEMVSDVRRMAEWSPQVTSTRLRAGFDTIGLGTQFTNRNVNGEAVWTTHGEIVRFDHEREMAFRIEENWLIWSFTLEPTAAGTRPSAPAQSLFASDRRGGARQSCCGSCRGDC